MDASLTEPFRFSVDSHFDATTDHSAEADLARQTRQEIQRLVRDIASLCHSRQPEHRFWLKFLGLVGSAMASEGGVVWRRSGSAWEPIAHVGIVDRRILTPDATDPSSHQRLVAEVGNSAGPVIVPPGTPWDFDEPGNPTDHLAAIVPVPVDADEPVQWLVEQFLPVGGGPATLRGYLRFVAQMADLAAEYVRGARLRTYRQSAEWSSRMQIVLADLHDFASPVDAERGIVDAVVELVGAERVSLVRRLGGVLRVVAVSGVDRPDPLSPAVELIRQCAAECDGPVGFTRAEPDAQDAASPNSDANVLQDGSLVLRGIAVLDPRGDWRLVVEDPMGDAPHDDSHVDWTTLVRHLGLVLRHRERVTQRRFAAWVSGDTSSAHSVARRAAMWTGVVAVFALAAFMPFPLIVTADGRLEPLRPQTLYAPREGIVAEIWVEHGDRVRTGDPLLQLVDVNLEKSIHALVSRRATLLEKTQELERRLARDGSRDRDQAERLQSEIGLGKDELVGVEGELELLRAQERQMLVRAGRDGVIDAWQAQAHLANRPVVRGQSLLRIVDPDGEWTVQVDIPQERLDAVLGAREAGEVRADVVVGAFPSVVVPARMTELGPVVPARTGAGPVGMALFSVSEDLLPIRQSGTPARVAIRCGTSSLGYVACRDLLKMVESTVRLYW